MIPTHAACGSRAISPEYAHQLRPGCQTAKHSPCPAGMSRSKKTAGHRLLIPRSVCAEHRTDKNCRGKSDALPACCSIVAFSCGLVLRCMETSVHKHTGRTGTQNLRLLCDGNQAILSPAAGAIRVLEYEETIVGNLEGSYLRSELKQSASFTKSLFICFLAHGFPAPHLHQLAEECAGR